MKPLLLLICCDRAQCTRTEASECEYCSNMQLCMHIHSTHSSTKLTHMLQKMISLRNSLLNTKPKNPKPQFACVRPGSQSRSSHFRDHSFIRNFSSCHSAVISGQSIESLSPCAVGPPVDDLMTSVPNRTRSCAALLIFSSTGSATHSFHRNSISPIWTRAKSLRRP